MTSPDAVVAAVGAVIDPEIRKPLGELGMVGDVLIEGSRARVTIRLTIEACPKRSDIEAEVRRAAAGVPGITDATIEFGVLSGEERAALTSRLHGGRTVESRFGPQSLTRVVAVTSGKGGVGKSTVAANVAVALGQRGFRVGLLDADVHGFSIPAILGIEGEKPTKVDDMILPPIAFGVSVISIGMFVEPHTSVSWRGPMLHRTVNQFLTDVYFGDIDVLVCDLPPGTGDVAIAFGQAVPHADVIVATTPQRGASDVAERSGLLARQLGQRVIGVIECMSDWVDEDGVEHRLFGSGGGDVVAERLGVPLMGRVPLSDAVSRSGDLGTPIVVAEPNHVVSRVMSQIAASIAETSLPRVGSTLPLRITPTA